MIKLMMINSFTNILWARLQEIGPYLFCYFMLLPLLMLLMINKLLPLLLLLIKQLNLIDYLRWPDDEINLEVCIRLPDWVELLVDTG